MRFSTSFFITLLSSLTIVILDKGSGLLILKLLADRPDLKGGLDLLSTFPFILMAVSNLGLATSLIYFVRRGEATVREAGETTAMVAVVWGGICVLAALLVLQVLAAFHPEVEVPAMSLVLPLFLATPFMLIVSYRNSIQLALGQIRAYNLIHLIPSLTYLPIFLLFYFLLTNKDAAHAVVYARFLPAVLTASIILWLVRKEVPLLPKFHRKFFWKALSFGWRANLNSTLTYLNHRVDLFLVRLFYAPTGFAMLQAVFLLLFLGIPLGPGRSLEMRMIREEVAFYSLAVTLAELVWYFPDAMRDLLFTKVAGIKEEEARVFTPVICRNMFWICAVGGGLIYFIYDPLMGLWMGDSWETLWRGKVSMALTFLLPGTLFFTIAKVLQADLTGRGFINVCLFLSGLVLVSMTLLDVFLIPRYGAAGASLASSMAYGLAAIATILAYQKRTGVPLRALLIPQRKDWEIYKGFFLRFRRKHGG